MRLESTQLANNNDNSGTNKWQVLKYVQGASFGDQVWRKATLTLRLNNIYNLL